MSEIYGKNTSIAQFVRQGYLDRSNTVNEPVLRHSGRLYLLMSVKNVYFSVCRMIKSIYYLILEPTAVPTRPIIECQKCFFFLYD